MAEWIPASEDISSATIVSVDPDNNEKAIASRNPYDSTVIGIVATQPGWLIGEQKQGSIQMALAGRVPTRVSLKNGEIKRGDPITTSDIPGVGMKATREGDIIGKAMDELKGDAGTTGTIIVFVNPSHYNPDTYSPEEDQLFLTKIDSVTGDVVAGGKYSVIRKTAGQETRPVLTSQAFQQAIIGELKAGNASIEGILSADDVLVGGVSLKDKMSNLSLDTSFGYTLTTSLDSLTHRVESSEQKVVSNEQRITQLEDLVAIMAGFASPELLTQAGTNTLTTSSNPSFYSLLSTPYSLSGSYMNNELAIKTATNLTYDTSTNTTHVLGSATIGGNLTIGLLTINDMDASINSMGETLKLQSLGLSNIELMSGKIVIDTEGNIKVGGNIEAQTVTAEEFKVTGTKSAGSAILRAGDLTLTVSTDVITPESRIFTQVTSTPENAGTVQDNAGISLVVTKLPGIGFEVRLPAPAEIDTTFDWFVIGGN
mgnify:CR=1 FL=1